MLVMKVKQEEGQIVSRRTMKLLRLCSMFDVDGGRQHLVVPHTQPPQSFILSTLMLTKRASILTRISTGIEL